MSKDCRVCGESTSAVFATNARVCPGCYEDKGLGEGGLGGLFEAIEQRIRADERAKVVAWIRVERSYSIDGPVERVLGVVADAIERGEHSSMQAIELSAAPRIDALRTMTDDEVVTHFFPTGATHKHGQEERDDCQWCRRAKDGAR
jgi:hypothetical protein